MHRLLKRQIKRTIGKEFEEDEKLQPLLSIISDYYHDIDKEKELFENAYNISEVELRKANEQIKKSSESRTNAILNTLSEGLLAVDRKKDLIFINPSIEKLFCVKKSDAPNLASIVGKESKCFAHISLVLLGDEVEYQGEEILKTKNGREFPVEYYINPITQDGEIVGAVASITDISERKERENQLKESRDKALEASKMKSEFLSTMSHELRTPLNGVIGMSDIMLTTDLDSSQKEYASIIKESSYSLLQIINDILDFSKMEAGKLEILNVDMDVQKLVNNVKNLFFSKTAYQNIDLKVEIDEKIPHFIVGDDLRLRQILTNLIGNAIKFTEEGFVAISVNIKKEKLLFSVKDSGIGIKEDVIPKLFSSFTQADGTTSRKFGGTGLGLAICKNLVELMNGEIWVESVYGKGSNFLFEIPFIASEKKSCELVTDDNSEAVFDKHILLAEDNEVNQKVAKFQLEKLGFKVSIANNGLEVLEQMEKQNFSLILMDCQMPEMDGYEATKSLRELNKKLPIIAMTANALEGDKEKCLSTGMDDYLGKPFTPKDLKEILSKWVKYEDNLTKTSSEEKEEIDDSIIKLERLNELFDEDRESIKEVLDIYIESSSNSISAIKYHLSDGNFVELKKDAHNLKGMSSNIGVDRVWDLCKKVEQASTNENEDLCNTLITEIETILPKVYQFIERY